MCEGPRSCSREVDSVGTYMEAVAVDAAPFGSDEVNRWDQESQAALFYLDIVDTSQAEEGKVLHDGETEIHTSVR